MAVQRIEFGRREAASAGSCACGHGDAGCLCGDASSTPAHDASTAVASPASAAGVELNVAGMTCDHCVRAVTEELLAVEGVTAVDVRLVPQGVSRVRVQADAPLSTDALAAAVDEAGYTLADA